MSTFFPSALSGNKNNPAIGSPNSAGLSFFDDFHTLSNFTSLSHNGATASVPLSVGSGINSTIDGKSCGVATLTINDSTSIANTGVQIVTSDTNTSYGYLKEGTLLTSRLRTSFVNTEDKGYVSSFFGLSNNFSQSGSFPTYVPQTTSSISFIGFYYLQSESPYWQCVVKDGPTSSYETKFATNILPGGLISDGDTYKTLGFSLLNGYVVFYNIINVNRFKTIYIPLVSISSCGAGNPIPAYNSGHLYGITAGLYNTSGSANVLNHLYIDYIDLGGNVLRS